MARPIAGARATGQIWRIMRRIPSLCLLFAVPCLIAPAAAAPLLVVTGDDYPPFASVNLPDGGFSLPLVRAAFAASGMDITIEIMPWRRGYDMVLRGEAIATFPYVDTPERRRETAFSDALYEVVQDLVARREDPPAFDGRPESLKGLTICMPFGYALPPVLERRVEQGAMARVSPADPADCANLVARGRADIAVGDRWSLRRIVAATGLQHSLATLQPPFSRTSHHAVFSRAAADWPGLLDAFNRGLARVKATPAYAGWLHTNIAADQP